MQENQKLFEFTQAFGNALELIEIANQVPEFVLSNARELNTEKTSAILSQFENDIEVFNKLASKGADAKISHTLDFETKRKLYTAIEKLEAAIDNVNSAHYKLRLERYVLSSKLASQVKLILRKLVLAEQELNEKK